MHLILKLDLYGDSLKLDTHGSSIKYKVSIQCEMTHITFKYTTHIIGYFVFTVHEIMLCLKIMLFCTGIYQGDPPHEVSSIYLINSK
jgi:hypothetical protein